MEDFEYSVEICDRDWERFFVVCEECNLLPPSLEVVDDLANRVQKVDPTARFPGVGHPSDGSPDCEGSPVEDYLSKHGVSGMESVLWDSEEDRHLQSVNTSFGQLKNTTGVERFSETSQERAGKIREEVQVEEHCCDGQQTSSIPELHCLPARGTSEPFGTISTVMKKDESGSNISSEAAASKKSAHPESKLMVREEACTKTRLNEATPWRQSQDSPDGAGTTPNNDKVINVERSAPLGDVKHEDMLKNQFTPKKTFSSDSWSNLEMMTNDKRRENQSVSNPDATSATKTASQGSSPSASVRRKRRRRRKRQLGAEPAEGEPGGERRVLVKLSDSDEERHWCRGGAGLCVCGDINSFDLNEPLNSVTSSSAAYSEKKGSDLSHRGPPRESAVGQGRRKATGSAEDNASKAPLSQTDDGVKSAMNNCGDVATDVQPCSKVQVEESAVLDAKRGRKDIHGGNLQQSDQMNSVDCCENEQLCTATVKPLIHNILPNDPTVEVGQSHKLSAAKSVLAEEAGNSGNNTLCQRPAEPQQQLGIGPHHTAQYSSAPEKTHIPLFAESTRSSGALNTKPMQSKTRVDSVKTVLESNSSADKRCLSDSPSSLESHITAQRTEHPVLPHTNTTAERREVPASQMKTFRNRNPSPAGETNLTGKSQGEVKSSTSEDFLTRPSDGAPVSSCCNLGMVLSTENITYMAGDSGVPVSHDDSGGQGQKALLAKRGEAQAPFVSNDPTDSNDDSVPDTEDAAMASKAADVPEMATTPSPFVMSSFWSEMEKVTIKDILGLQMIRKAAPPSERTDVSSQMESGFFNQRDESKPKQTNEDTSSDGNSHSGSVSSRRVTWESEHMRTAKVTSVGDISPPVQSAQTCHRKISKNLSLRNLHVLESFDNTWGGQPLQTPTKGELENVDCDNGHMPKQDKDVDCLASSVTGRYRISLTDIFHYLFGAKQSNPSQSATDDITASYTDGNSVPETYDRFFSEFDFFSPLTTADQANEEPASSCSYSANANLQFPEAYDYFFASSSSDDSPEESDEEDNSCPVRVVNGLSQRSDEISEISTDVYENFFTDDDLRQNFFWKSTFSVRKIHFTSSPVVQKHSLSNPAETVRPSSRSLRRTVNPTRAFGDHNVKFSDPLLYNLEERISRQRAQQPFGLENSETAANPTLDFPLLPLRQSDMCLVCIAFASWVLKTANPQVGDAWKAVLLANISALSAIRYLRKYAEMEAAAGETKEISFQHHL